MARVDHIDDNEQCPFCKRWFQEGHGLDWHIRAKHSAEAAKFHKLFTENARRTHERKRVH